MKEKNYRVKREAVPNHDDEGHTTLHLAEVICNQCNAVLVSVKNADKYIAENMARRLHRLNGGHCEHCSNIAAQADPEFSPDPV